MGGKRGRNIGWGGGCWVLGSMHEGKGGGVKGFFGFCFVGCIGEVRREEIRRLGNYVFGSRY